MNNQIEDEAAAKCTSNKSKPKHHNPYLLQYRRSSYSAHECNIVLPPIYIKPRTLSTMLTYYDQ